ncbi:MAG: hypothetical protein MPJ50_17300, partial [Pirellulales bacterium]|nr:hypothetical protein [Pirellulales bacterium]
EIHSFSQLTVDEQGRIDHINYISVAESDSCHICNSCLKEWSAYRGSDSSVNLDAVIQASDASQDHIADLEIGMASLNSQLPMFACWFLPIANSYFTSQIQFGLSLRELMQRGWSATEKIACPSHLLRNFVISLPWSNQQADMSDAEEDYAMFRQIFLVTDDDYDESISQHIMSLRPWITKLAAIFPGNVIAVNPTAGVEDPI